MLPEVPYLLNNMALYLKCRGRYEEAKELFEEALAIRREMPGAERLDIAYNLDYLAELYRKLGRFEKAREYYQEAQMIYEHWLLLIPVHLASALTHQAEIHIEQRHFAEAAALLQRSLEICRQSLGTAHPLTQEAAARLERLSKQISEEEEGK